MAFCKKCGAYIPIDETACPACGYDPEAEAREAQERAEEEARRKAQQEQSWAAQERKREEEARRREQERARREQQRQQSYTAGAAGTQYTSQRTGQSSASQGQYASQRAEQTWTPPWSEGQSASQSSQSSYTDMRSQAQDSVENQRLSILSYLGLLFLIPLFLRKNDPFARFHSNQGLVLFLFTAIAGALIPASSGLAALVSLFDIFCVIKGISNVVRGKMEPLPLIGKIKLLK